MIKSIRRLLNRIRETEFARRYIGFNSSIYGRVVLIIIGSFVILLILLNFVFRSLYADYFNSTLRQSGDNMNSIVEGALYYSMLENDKFMLQRTLDVISTMSGIDGVSLYDHLDSLAYTSTLSRLEESHDPDCVACADDLSSMFPENENNYRIVKHAVKGEENQKYRNTRQLLIRKPIMNERSCYTADCHAHNENEVVLGTLIIKLPLEDLDSVVDESLANFLILVTLITILLVTILIIFTKKKIQNPLKSIILASEAVSSGINSIRLDIKPNLLNDMMKVSLAFNNMLENMETSRNELRNWSQQLEYKVQKKTEELLEAQNELIHVERIASLGKLSSSVAHEINNPLSGILVYTKLIHKQLNNSDFQHKKKEAILKQLKLIENETKRCGDIVKGLLDFSSKEQEDFENMDLHELLDITYRLMIHSIKIANINFVKDFKADSHRVHCSPNQVKQAFVALLVNASEAIQENGEIVIGTCNPDDETIRVDITDNGQGIPYQNISHIFEPFFSTKHDMSGIGLGLSIVHGIIENHNGKIEVDSEIGKGTTVSILFPLSGN
jgi:two-component system, NtrC family, sensor kinase